MKRRKNNLYFSKEVRNNVIWKFSQPLKIIKQKYEFLLFTNKIRNQGKFIQTQYKWRWICHALRKPSVCIAWRAGEHGIIRDLHRDLHYIYYRRMPSFEPVVRLITKNYQSFILNRLCSDVLCLLLLQHNYCLSGCQLM